MESARVCNSLKRCRSWASAIWPRSRLDTWWATLNTARKWPDDRTGWRQWKCLCPYIFCTAFPSAASLVSPVGPHLKESERGKKKKSEKVKTCLLKYQNHCCEIWYLLMLWICLKTQEVQYLVWQHHSLGCCWCNPPWVLRGYSSLSPSYWSSPRWSFPPHRDSGPSRSPSEPHESAAPLKTDMKRQCTQLLFRNVILVSYGYIYTMSFSLTGSFKLMYSKLMVVKMKYFNIHLLYFQKIHSDDLKSGHKTWLRGYFSTT